MKLRNTLILAMIAVLALLALLPFAAHADTLASGMHACTRTNPEYVLTDDGATVTSTPGTYQFTAQSARSGWDDAYAMTGYSRGSNSATTCGHYGRYSYNLPVPATAQISGSLASQTTGYYSRPGWDIWLVHAGSQYQETSNTTMQADPRTVEIMLQPGQPYGHAYTSRPSWYRIFTFAGDLKNVNITSLIANSLASAGLNPSDYYVEAIGGGAEFISATFKLTGYSLSVSAPGQYTATAQESYTAVFRNSRFPLQVSATATASVTRHTAVLVKGTSYATAEHQAQAEAVQGTLQAAQAQARANAVKLATDEAHRILAL